jgi:hypothetical protein
MVAESAYSSAFLRAAAPASARRVGRPRRLPSKRVLVATALVLGTGSIQLPPVADGLRGLALLPRQPAYTELSFVDPNHLPSHPRPGSRVTVLVAVRNVGGPTRSYAWAGTLTSACSPPTAVDGAVRVAEGGTATIPVALAVPARACPAQVSIRLLSRPERVAFTITPTAAPSS